MCPPLCGVFCLRWASWSAPLFGVGPHSWPLGRFWMAPFCWRLVATWGGKLGNGAGGRGLMGWVVAGLGGWGCWSRFSVGSQGLLLVPSFLPGRCAYASLPLECRKGFPSLRSHGSLCPNFILQLRHS
ncbi:hypothetical protein XENOCAPTIV_020068 [Xenoophorus captivus]|uniref:Secreted protein n=1 Tax=Xenoophorus captivus TaxID=1517983 RepID=A0ABV0RZK9_9TELE